MQRIGEFDYGAGVRVAGSKRVSVGRWNFQIGWGKGSRGQALNRGGGR